MINIQIELTEDEYLTIQKHAAANKLAPEEYARNMITSWARSHMRAELQKQLNALPLEEAKKIFKKDKL